MKNTFLFLSDTHLGFDYPVRPRIKRRRRGFDAFSQFTDALNYALENKIVNILHGGDLFFRSKVPKPIIDKVYHLLNDYAEKGLEFYIVPGNHERSVLPKSSFLLHQNIHVFGEHKTYQIEMDDMNISLSGFPYQKNIEHTFEKHLHKTEFYNFDGYRIVIIHQAIAGTTVGVQNYMFRSGPEVIHHNKIPSTINMLLSGHIHRQQESIINGVHVLLSGSTVKTSFAEMYEKKGFYRITLINDGKKILAEKEFIELRTRKMHRLTIKQQDFSQDDSINTLIINKLKRLPQDCIVQICFDKSISENRLSNIDTREIRDKSSKTMNIEFHRRIWRRSNND